VYSSRNPWTPAAVSGCFLPRMSFTLTSHQALIEANNVLANMRVSRPLSASSGNPPLPSFRDPNLRRPRCPGWDWFRF
jgi:hypothetical protein